MEKFFPYNIILENSTKDYAYQNYFYWRGTKNPSLLLVQQEKAVIANTWGVVIQDGVGMIQVVVGCCKLLLEVVHGW